MSKTNLKIKPNVKSEILRKAIAYVQENYDHYQELPLFHEFEHITEVVNVADKLADKHELSNDSKEILLLSAWFFFTGYKRKKKNFTKESASIATAFLKDKDYEQSKIDRVSRLITSDLQKSDDLVAQLLHDALVSYKGRKRFFTKVEQLRVERETLRNQKYTDYDWERMMFRHLVSSTFFTDAARRKYQKRKIANLKKQRDNIQEAHKVTIRKKTGKEFGRGVDTLYRANYNNHISLSSIADGKANMMISINTIILSVIVTLSGAGFTLSGNFIIDHVRFTIPILFLLIGSLISVIFAVVSARPKVTNHTIDMKDVENDKSSLLFFGNFLQVPLEEFIDHLEDLKESQKKLYDSMSIDLYHLGEVLQNKYKWLKYSYNAFMYGLILCVFAFVLIFLYTNLSH